MQAGKVDALTKIESIKYKLDYCEIIIEGYPYKVFCDYNDYIRYIDVTIAFEVRNDIYKGEQIEVIEGIIERKTLVTVTKEEDIKLLPDITNWTGICNFALSSLRPGEEMSGCIFYLSDMYEDASDKAKWFQLKVIDMVSKVYEIKMFTSGGQSKLNMREGINAYKGTYIKCDVVYSKYGLQTREIEPYLVDVVEPPEVSVAVSIIENAVKDDKELKSYMQQYNFIDELKRVIEVEPGYHLVRIAMELGIIKYINNISELYSQKILTRSSIVSRGYLLNKKNELSKTVLNVNKIMRSKLSTDIELINTIDVLSTNTTQNKRIYIEIRKFTDFILRERRGMIDEKEVVSNIDSISSSFGWML